MEWNRIEIDDPYRFPPLLSDFDLHLHGEGTHYETYNMLGSHLVESEGVPGVRFAVWAPNAEVVSVIGDFNDWDTRRHPMRLRTGGVWELFLPGLARAPTTSILGAIALPGLPSAEGRSLRIRLRSPAEIGFGRLPISALQMDRRRLDGSAREERLSAGAGLDL